jgi:isocitrate dehydrogenase
VWCWPTGSHTILVNAIKQKICFKPILSIFNPKLPLIVYTDASRDGYAGILVQLSDNREKSIAFFSKQTTSPEKNYHSFELSFWQSLKPWRNSEFI